LRAANDIKALSNLYFVRKRRLLCGNSLHRQDVHAAYIHEEIKSRLNSENA